MKPALKTLLLLFLLGGAWLVEAGKHGRHDANKGQWGYSDRDHSRKHEYAYYSRADSRTHSRGHRRRRSKSDSRSPARTKKTEKPAKDSPGYEEYKRQKAEAAAWQERRLQAQALALCLEERELQKKAESSQPLANVGPPPELAPAPKVAESASHSKLEAEHETSPTKNVLPPLPKRTKKDCKPQTESGDDKISVAMLKLLEAELGHVVNLGNKPLTAQAVETRLVSAKPPGKVLDGFILRHGKGQQAPPTRIASKAKMAAAVLKELHF